MSETVEPALTPEEWAQKAVMAGYVPFFRITEGGHLELPDATEKWTPEDKERHALAALALYGQPFGFTREDVEELSWRAEQSPYEHEGAVLFSIAARIAALLPPTPTETPE